jgi:hypothetical protein
MAYSRYGPYNVRPLNNPYVGLAQPGNYPGGAAPAPAHATAFRQSLDNERDNNALRARTFAENAPLPLTADQQDDYNASKGPDGLLLPGAARTLQDQRNQQTSMAHRMAYIAGQQGVQDANSGPQDPASALKMMLQKNWDARQNAESAAKVGMVQSQQAEHAAKAGATDAWSQNIPGSTAAKNAAAADKDKAGAAAVTAWSQNVPGSMANKNAAAAAKDNATAAAIPIEAQAKKTASDANAAAKTAYTENDVPGMKTQIQQHQKTIRQLQSENVKLKKQLGIDTGPGGDVPAPEMKPAPASIPGAQSSGSFNPFVRPAAAVGKPLDEATAMGILRETSGDKNRARQLALARGFSVA